MNIRFVNVFLKIFYTACLVFLCAEIYVYTCGVEPFKAHVFTKYNFEDEKVIEDTGWSAAIDEEDYAADGEDPSVIIHFWNKGRRQSRKIYNKKSKFKTAFLGCSYTFGVGVESEDTMVWRLNDKYPDVSFDNYGISGWGPAQMHAKLKHLLSNKEDYNLIVYNAIHDHLFRSFAPRASGDVRKNEMYTAVPYGGWNCFNIFKVYYCSDLLWPFEYRSSVCSLLKRIYYAEKTSEYEHLRDTCNDVQSKDLKLKKYVGDCYAEIVNSMYDMCSEAGIDFVVVDLEDYHDSILDNDKIRAEVILADMPDEKIKLACNRVLNNPEFHPNKNVHKYWADRFSEWFDERYGKRLKNI